MTQPSDVAPVESVVPGGWRDAVQAALARGERFCGGYAQHEGAATEFRVAWTQGGRTRILACATTDGVLPTIVDLVTAAGWDEREAADLFGLVFDGHEPQRALVLHPEPLAAWTTDVAGEGFIRWRWDRSMRASSSPGFRFHVVGERILLVDPRLFYKHRGLERAAESGDVERALAHAGRACGHARSPTPPHARPPPSGRSGCGRRRTPAGRARCCWSSSGCTTI